MTDGEPNRLGSLDLIRGVAVLGILAINIAGLAGPPAATLSPNIPFPGSEADQWAFAIKFLLFEGKMRALFTVLFGASLVLFIDRADAAGRPGSQLQMRRLIWLALFGLAHFYVLWWGDILFLYAVAGIIALAMRGLSVSKLLLFALSIFAIWHTSEALQGYPDVTVEHRVLAGTATEAENRDYTIYRATLQQDAEQDIRDVSGSFISQMSIRTNEDTFMPILAAISNLGETLPLIMIGMALMRSGFFSGGWSKRQLAWSGLGATTIGLILTWALLRWTWALGFPLLTMEWTYLYAGALPHFITAMGYAAFWYLLPPHCGA